MLLLIKHRRDLTFGVCVITFTCLLLQATPTKAQLATCEFSPDFDFAYTLEESPPGTLIYAIDVGGSETEISLSIYDCIDREGCDDWFTIDGKNVTWKMQYDLEANDCKGDFRMRIQCTEVGIGPSPLAFELIVVVQDLNEFEPEFLGTPYKEDVFELTHIDSTVCTVAVDDGDCEDGPATIHFRVIDDDGSSNFAFKTINTAEVILIEPLDYETQPKHNVTLEADDRRGLNSTTILEVTVLDEDDMTPIFNQVTYVTEVYENEVGVTIDIDNLLAYDQDLAINENVYYSFDDQNRTNDFMLENEYLAIESSNTTITVIKAFDREASPGGQMSFTLRAAQNNTKGYELYAYRDTQALLTVTIIDVNDHPPKFETFMYEETTMDGEPIFYAEEMRENSTFVGRVFTTDEDIGINANVTYAIEAGNEDGLFKIDATSGRIFTDATLDYSEKKEHTLTISAANIYADINSNVTTIMDVTVRVTDVNNHAPQFTNAPYAETISSQSHVGFSILTVETSDEDEGLNSEVFYTLDAYCNDTGVCQREALMYFAIGKDDGILTVAAPLPSVSYHIQFEFYIVAIDNGSPSLSNRSIATIRVQNITYGQPIFLENDHSFNITEEEPPFTTCESLPVPETESEDDEIDYAITGGDCEYEDHFVLRKIDGRTCEICNAMRLDRETVSSYTFVVTATVNVSDVTPCDPNLNLNLLYHNQLMLYIYVLDINEPPVFEQTVFFKGIHDNTPYGTSLLQVEAVDDDEGINGTLCYHQEESHDHEKFDVVCNSGDVYAADSNFVGYAGGRQLTFFVYATDRAGPDGDDDGLVSNNTAEVKIHVLQLTEYCIMESGRNPTYISSNVQQIIGELEYLYGYTYMFDSVRVSLSDSGKADVQTDMWFYVVRLEDHTVLTCQEFIAISDILTLSKVGVQEYTTTPGNFTSDWDFKGFYELSSRGQMSKTTGQSTAGTVVFIILAVTVLCFGAILIIYLLIEERYCQKELLQYKERMEKLRKPLTIEVETGETSDERVLLDAATEMDKDWMQSTPATTEKRTVIHEAQEMSMELFHDTSDYGDDNCTHNAFEKIKAVAIDNPAFVDHEGNLVNANTIDFGGQDDNGYRKLEPRETQPYQRPSKQDGWQSVGSQEGDEGQPMAPSTQSVQARPHAGEDVIDTPWAETHFIKVKPYPTAKLEQQDYALETWATPPQPLQDDVTKTKGQGHFKPEVDYVDRKGVIERTVRFNDEVVIENYEEDDDD
ncbi:cadherin EGF LAG seven-pass G-type receptor 2-like [Ptychodera flava]|uniref:cadherin EGF LAG seven-pass G-type receptor 2-like n=1 Tax=Ptychodera flava TaxID=63121 RepID=UPI00396AAB37